MKKKWQTLNLFKIMVCSLLVMVFSSFSSGDPCAPTDDQVRASCEYDSVKICVMTNSTAGDCNGKRYEYTNNRKKETE